VRETIERWRRKLVVPLTIRRDELYLYSARAVQSFGDGFAAIVLPAYLVEVGFSPFQIGVGSADPHSSARKQH